jgi:hypothetical protein
LLGISGMAGGLVIGLLSRRQRTTWIEAQGGTDVVDEDTHVVTGEGPDEETSPVG